MSTPITASGTVVVSVFGLMLLLLFAVASQQGVTELARRKPARRQSRIHPFAVEDRFR
jgi:hypothetical protein